MSDWSDEDLESLLTLHLNASLDGQLGRAAAAFVAATGPASSHASRRGRWVFWASGAASIAAMVAVAWVTVGHPLRKKVEHAPTVGPVAVNDLPPMVQSTSWSGVVDEGLAVVDEQPVRRLRRDIVEEVEWYDAKDGAVVKTRVPRQQFFLIGLKTD
jgi:hypothetical protein